MKNEEAVRQELHRAGLRATPQRLRILSILAQAGEARTAEEIFRLCPPGETNLSTVYRTLGTLCQKGALSRALGVDGVYGYYLEGTRHRHQLICTRCGCRQDLPVCPMEELEQRLERDTGYRITGHSLELSGICPRCRQETGDHEE